MANIAVRIAKPCARIQTYPYHLEDGDVRVCDSMLRHVHAGGNHASDEYIAVFRLPSQQQCQRLVNRCIRHRSRWIMEDHLLSLPLLLSLLLGCGVQHRHSWLGLPRRWNMQTPHSYPIVTIQQTHSQVSIKDTRPPLQHLLRTSLCLVPPLCNSA